MVAAEGVAQALSVLPAHLLEGLKSIHYEPIPLLPGITRWIRMPGRKNLLGRYDPKSCTIHLHAADSRSSLFYALFHELGHFVYFRVISPAEKKRWVTRVYQAEAPVSQYGGRNAAEDFAEAFALVLSDPELLGGRPLKARFLRETVFRSARINQSVLDDIVSRSRESDVESRLDRLV